MKNSCLVTSLAFAAMTLSGLRAAETPPEPANAGVSIWTQNVTGFRKEHGAVGGYTTRWDLSAMPHYVPKQQVTGTLRIWGNNYIKDANLAEYWREAFKKFQPGITIDYHLPTATIAVPAIASGAADLGLCYRARLTDLLVFEQVFHHPITEITTFGGVVTVSSWATMRSTRRSGATSCIDSIALRVRFSKTCCN